MNKEMADFITKDISDKTTYYNYDNITRTNAYKDYFLRNKEITWAYLANMVSRNAGWSMSDLWSRPYRTLLTRKQREHLFITYERANWMIFSDAFPQLLVYEWSKKLGSNLFFLLRRFRVSEWMIHQWEIFWETQNKHQLLFALIINEQHLIQEPVIESPFFYNNVFKHLDYHLQEKLHFSVVLFPTIKGEIFGQTIKKFTKVEWRVELGKKLSWILLDSLEKDEIYYYFNHVPFTASRSDYQKFQVRGSFKTPMMKAIYPHVLHGDQKRHDWSRKKRYSPNKLLRKELKTPKRYRLTDWYGKKQKQIILAASLYDKFLRIVK